MGAALKKHIANSIYSSPFTTGSKASKILIVDDDIDTAIVLNDVFRMFGCNVSYAESGQEAVQKILKERSHIVILDWQLSSTLTGGDIIKNTSSKISKFKDLQELFSLRQPKLISYSSLPKAEIIVPDSNYFDYIGHWEKSMSHMELSRRALRLLNAMGA